MNPDIIFKALADKTRRDILLRIKEEEFSVSELAEPFSMSLPAISKHLKVLGNAGLINKTKQGKIQWVGINKKPLQEVEDIIFQLKN